MLALMYLDRVMTLNPSCFLHCFNFQRLILGAFIAAIKYHEETVFCYGKFALMPGLSKAAVSTIERAFLKASDYHLFVTEKEYENAEYKLVNEAVNGIYPDTVLNLLRNENLPTSIGFFETLMGAMEGCGTQ